MLTYGTGKHSFAFSKAEDAGAWRRQAQHFVFKPEDMSMSSCPN